MTDYKEAIAKAVNDDFFTCMYCRETKPFKEGVRRALNEFVDLFHCFECMSVEDKDMRMYALRALAHPEDPVVEDMVNRLANEAVEFLENKMKLN